MCAARLLVSVIALFVSAGSGLVSPAVADDAATCNHASGDEAIAACTRVIQNPGRSTEDRAAAYVTRGFAYHAKGDGDRAIEVPPVSWTPEHLCSRSPQWPESTHPTRRSSGGR
jgi:hypothetical protein